MKTNLIRYGGPAAVLGGVLLAVLFLLDELAIAGVLTGALFESHWGYHVLNVPMNMLLTIGVLGLFAHQAASFGKPGKVGSYLSLAGFALATLGGIAIIGFELGVGEESTPGVLDMFIHLVAALLFVVGSVVFGVATLRAGVLPRGGALLAILGPIVFFGMIFFGVEGGLPIVLGPALFGLGWAWLGYALLSERGEPADQAARVS